MIPDQWHLGLVIAVGAVTLLLLYWLLAVRRRRGRSAEADGNTWASEPGGIDPDAGVVECPTRGVENEPGYRFCRDCVGELPGAIYPRRSAGAPLGRPIR